MERKSSLSYSPEPLAVKLHRELRKGVLAVFAVESFVLLYLLGRETSLSRGRVEGKSLFG